MLARLGRDLPPRLRAPLDAHVIRGRVTARLANRGRAFADALDTLVFQNPGSPYRSLFSCAGAELGDVRALVDSDGLEGALTVLAARGLYVRIDELKGQREVVRGSFRTWFDPDAFNHPALSGHLAINTGGSGRRPSRVRYSLQFLEEWACSVALAATAHGFAAPTQVFWWPVPMAHAMMAGMVGQSVAGWFYPVHPLPFAAHCFARWVSLVSVSAGCRIPGPRRLDLQEPERMAHWLARERRERGPMLLWATSSACARLGRAAWDAGLSLDGVACLATAEPMTETRLQEARRASMRVIVGYSSVDVSAPAYGCAAPDAVDDMHVMLDRCALISHRRRVNEDGPEIDALLSTSLSMHAPKVAINCETGDYGVLEERDCGCSLGGLPMRRHLKHVGSFEKLSTEGVTFARTDLLRILEEVLPRRFGGALHDYQVAEEEEAGGAPTLVIRVSPSLGALDEAAVRETFVAALSAGGGGNAYFARVLDAMGTARVRREPPRATAAGKVLPLHLLPRP